MCVCVCIYVYVFECVCGGSVRCECCISELQLYVHPTGVATNFNDLVTRLKRQRQ